MNERTGSNDFVLVPREPTEAMLDAAHEVSIACFSGDEECFTSNSEATSIYCAMIDARPMEKTGEVGSLKRENFALRKRVELAEQGRDTNQASRDEYYERMELAEASLRRIEGLVRSVLWFRLGPSIEESGIPDSKGVRTALAKLEAAITGDA